MHHADLDFDVTTGSRFHPIEIVLSMLIKFGVVVALGAPALGVLVFEVLLNATSMFNHGNARLPARLDRYLRWFVVTPDMHRVHHSIVVNETNSNFGFNLPWWDQLLGTYRDQPAAGHEGMTIGIEQFREARELWLDRMLLQPFRGPAGSLRDYLEACGMNWRNLILRSVLVAALAAAIIWLGLHRELPQPATIERELERFGGWRATIRHILSPISSRRRRRIVAESHCQMTWSPNLTLYWWIEPSRSLGRPDDGCCRYPIY